MTAANGRSALPYDQAMPPLRPETAARRAAEARALGRCLSSARQKAGLTQAEVAEALGLPQSHIAKLELGQRHLRFLEGLRPAALYAIDPADLDPSG